jgi:hypothetical protein
MAGLALVTASVQAQAPGNVRQLAEAAGITAPIVAWCQGQFRPGQRGYAVAAGGRYVAIDGNGAAVELAMFTGKPDLSCYTRTQARDLHRDLQRSDTLDGEIRPRFATSVICGFVDAITATCAVLAGRPHVRRGGRLDDVASGRRG